MSRRTSRSGRGGRRKKGEDHRLRNLQFVVSLFVGLALLVALIAPPIGVTRAVRGFLYHRFGLLSFFAPLLFLQLAGWTLDIRYLRNGFRYLLGGFVTAFFLACLVDLVGRRLFPSVAGAPGGMAAGGLVDAAVSSIGPIISYLALLTLFTSSLVLLTGWDLLGDVRSLLDRLASVRMPRMRVRRKVAGGGRGRPAGSGGKEADADGPPSLRTPERAGQPEQEESAASGLPGGFSKDEPLRAAGDSKGGGEARRRPATKERTPAAVSRGGGDATDEAGAYTLPEPSILMDPPLGKRGGESREELRRRSEMLVEKLEDFGVPCRIVGSKPGPVLTRFELEPGPGVKVNRILGLADDLALAMRAKRVRILAPIPGRGVVGIEVPNAEPETVYLKEILDECDGKRIPIALGKRLGGDPFAADVCDMPHLLVAGATGSGKSVCLHSIISSILMTRNPREVRLALVDPKMLELSLYQEIPHLWSPVILQAGKATGLLEKLVEEMEDRYSKLTKEGARTIEEYNNEVKAGSEDERMPYVVVIIDELADLMLVSGSEVEQPIARLAQMARAVGIHLIVATQRPSVDVITGVIKANFPSRIAFNVQSKTDSRTILDMNGAEKLLGKGDMLFLPAASPEPVRVHGSFLSTDEAQRLVAFWRDQPSMPYEYEPPDDDVPGRSAAGELKLDDPLLDDARKLVVQFQQGSVSFLQRRLRVGYSRAARLIDMLEQMGVVGPFQGSKARDVLIDPAPEPAEDDGEDGEDGKDE